MSVTKSFVGTVTGILIERGQIDPEALVTSYLAELKGSVFEGAKVRNLLDMTVAAKIGDDPYTPIDQAAGWLPGDASSPDGLRKFLPTLRERDGAHGEKFIYLDPSPQVMAWIIERVSHKDFSEVLEETLWSRLGAQSDAYIALDHHQEAYTTPGLNVTLEDLARFAQMMAQGGSYNGQQIVPARWLKEIRAGGNRDAWTRGISASEYDDIKPLPGHLHGSYRDYWWGTDAACGRFAGIGIGGQLVVVDPIANMVAVKLSSTPDIPSGEKTTITAYRAIDAIFRALSGHGC
jgi:CubicO group peptidase (beta-lactamase class C family)